MSDESVNDLAYWFPKIEAAGLPVPETQIVTTEIDLALILDGNEPPGLDEFLFQLEDVARHMGCPCFLRTGYGSGKHDWQNTCYLADPGELGQHVFNLVEWSHVVDIMGLPHNTWVVRALIPTEEWFVCTGYGGFPVTREFRLFVRGDSVEHWQPYWPPDAIEQGAPDVENWRDYLASMSALADDELQELSTLAEQASGAMGGGYWSVDFLQDDEGEWWLTDMADGERSFRWDTT